MSQQDIQILYHFYFISLSGICYYKKVVYILTQYIFIWWLSSYVQTEMRRSSNKVWPIDIDIGLLPFSCVMYWKCSYRRHKAHIHKHAMMEASCVSRQVPVWRKKLIPVLWKLLESAQVLTKIAQRPSWRQEKHIQIKPMLKTSSIIWNISLGSLHYTRAYLSPQKSVWTFFPPSFNSSI